MGRNYTTKATTEGALRIELKLLLDMGFFKPKQKASTTLSWTSGASIYITGTHLGDEVYMRLQYVVTDSMGEKVEMNYKIHLDRVPSNLGRGEILYFICPSTGNRCRILYCTLGSHYFACKKAYKNSLYYHSQTVSKKYRDTDRFFTLEERLEKLYSRRATKYYNGKKSRRAKLIDRLEREQEIVDIRRWGALANMFENKYGVNL